MKNCWAMTKKRSSEILRDDPIFPDGGKTFWGFLRAPAPLVSPLLSKENGWKTDKSKTKTADAVLDADRCSLYGKLQEEAHQREEWRLRPFDPFNREHRTEEEPTKWKP